MLLLLKTEWQANEKEKLPILFLLKNIFLTFCNIFPFKSFTKKGRSSSSLKIKCLDIQTDRRAELFLHMQIVHKNAHLWIDTKNIV